MKRWWPRVVLPVPTAGFWASCGPERIEPVLRRLLLPRVRPAVSPVRETPTDIAGHRPQFDIGVLQYLWMRLAYSRVFALKPARWPGQVPQLSRCGRPGTKLLRNKPCRSNCANPLGVPDGRSSGQEPASSSRGFTSSNNSNDPSKMFHTGFHKTPCTHGDVRHAAPPANPTTPEDRGSAVPPRYANPHPVSPAHDARRKVTPLFVQVQSCHAPDR